MLSQPICPDCVKSVCELQLGTGSLAVEFVCFRVEPLEFNVLAQYGMVFAMLGIGQENDVLFSEQGVYPRAEVFEKGIEMVSLLLLIHAAPPFLLLDFIRLSRLA